jgi:two-component system, cell cycle sensor histidine kinase and response regulator CckA
VYLPSAEAKIERDVTETQPELAEGAEATILLVEDDELIRGLTRQMLEEHGYRILEASDGLSALKLVRTNGYRFDLVLTDVVMKGMSGPELVRELNRENLAPKVVYMSGYTGELIGERDFEEAESTLLEKPFTRAALLKAKP